MPDEAEFLAQNVQQFVDLMSSQIREEVIGFRELQSLQRQDKEVNIVSDELKE